MTKSKTLTAHDGQNIKILFTEDYTDIRTVLEKNRNIEDEHFFSPSLAGLHDPYLMPDMLEAVERILEARARQERVVIFGDYDVDGVSSTAILFRFFREIGIEVSYRLPHRVHDGYGLKSYFFDELASKDVKLVVTVDCGTRDIEPIRHAKSLGIDVIVTDHHAVPEVIPEEVIAVVNPKRKESAYPFPNLAGAGVAFKLVHAIATHMRSIGLRHREEGSYPENKKIFAEDSWIAACLAMTEPNTYNSTLTRYIDLASLGTVADCMPLIGENRIITALGLEQMKQSESSALRKYIANLDRDIDGDADIIGFQLGPRINAAGRMDSPLKALHWLLANEETVDDWLETVESLNTKRQEAVKIYTEDALMHVDATAPVLFYMHEEIEHGLIGLVAGKLTEAYNKPSIVLCRQHVSEPVKKREYEVIESDTTRANAPIIGHLVASCRSPEWCSLVELLDLSKDFFVRYGGHRQAAGFTISADRLDAFRAHIETIFAEKYDTKNLPQKTMNIECTLHADDVSLETLNSIDRFRPFGIGNMKPLFLLEDLTIRDVREIGAEKNHLSLTFIEIPNVKGLLWNYRDVFRLGIPQSGDIISPVITLERNIWNNKENVQMMIKNIIL